MKPKPIVCALAYISLFLAILLPPEAFSEGKMALLVSASFAFFISVAERRVDKRYIATGLIGFALLVLHSLTLSVDLYRSMEFVTTLWIYFALTGFFLYAGFDPVRPLAYSMVALTVIVSTFGLYQYFWGFEQLASFIANAGSSEAVKNPLLARVATHRVTSTLALPGTLWGFLVMAIPFHAALWGKQRLANAGIIVSFTLLMVTGFLTRSFGFLVGLLVMTLLWLFLHHRRMLWNRLSPVMLLLLVSGAAFYSMRRGAIAGANPLVLRFANWISAWSIFSMHPWGTGLNTFGVMYPRYMLAGANETQYAHNTLLQLTSELGYLALFAGVALILIAVKIWPQIARRVSERECVLIALSVWGIHNLLDIDLYFASVGAVGAVLIGTLLRNSERAAAPPGKFIMATLGIATLAVVMFSGLVLFSTQLQQRAQGERDNLKPLVALETLRQARAIMPMDSSLFLNSGEIELELSQKLHEPKYLTAAIASFSRAIALSPNKMEPHIGLGLCYSASRDMVGGIKEIRVAQQLYPDNKEARAIVRLMERNLNSKPQ